MSITPEMVEAATVILNPNLNAIETKRLTALEKKIDKGIKAFVEVGQALQEIRDAALFRQSHGTFEEYCQDKWAIGRNYAKKQIAAASVVAALGTDVPKPRNEATARPLASLLDRPDELKAAWSQAREIANAEGRKEPMAEDVIDTAVWKAHRRATMVAPKKTTQDQPDKSNRARLLEAMAIITEIPAKVGNIDLEAVERMDGPEEREERVGLIQDADAALMELIEALEASEVPA
jgi:hypothetical protein